MSSSLFLASSSSSSIITVHNAPDAPPKKEEHAVRGMNHVVRNGTRFHTSSEALSPQQAPSSNHTTSLWGDGQQQQHPHHWHWAGMARSAKEIKKNMWSDLVSLNCRHRGDDAHQQQQHPPPLFAVHALVQKDKEHGLRQIQKHRAWFQQQQQKPSSSNEPLECADFIIEAEDELVTADTPRPFAESRVARIARARDLRRQALQVMLAKATTQDHQQDDRGADAEQTTANDVVVVADLDLLEFPPLQDVVAQAMDMAPSTTSSSDAHQGDWDVACAAGIDVGLGTLKSGKHWCCDTFATILLPNTFTHPLAKRWFAQPFPEEDPKLIVDNTHFQQTDLSQHLRDHAVTSSVTGLAHTAVRSCFGGLALCRAPTFFESTCRCGIDPRPSSHNHNSTGHNKSDDDDEEDSTRYANDRNGFPCEHVIFHACLHRARRRRQRAAHGAIAQGGDGNNAHANALLRVSVNPHLITQWEWHKPPPTPKKG